METKSVYLVTYWDNNNEKETKYFDCEERATKFLESAIRMRLKATMTEIFNPNDAIVKAIEELRII